MATTAQVLANRENAQHSTGPRTEARKAISAANVARHYLTARGLIVPVGFESAFEGCEHDLRSNLVPPVDSKKSSSPGSSSEPGTFNAAVSHRLSFLNKLPPGALDPLLDDRLESEFARIDKYARQYENSMFKSMRELSKLQTEAQYRNEMHTLTEEELKDPDLFDSTPQSLSAVCEFRKIPAATPKHIPLQNRAKSDRAMDLLERLTRPPSLGDETMGEVLTNQAA